MVFFLLITVSGRFGEFHFSVSLSKGKSTRRSLRLPSASAASLNDCCVIGNCSVDFSFLYVIVFKQARRLVCCFISRRCLGQSTEEGNHQVIVAFLWTHLVMVLKRVSPSPWTFVSNSTEFETKILMLCSKGVKQGHYCWVLTVCYIIICFSNIIYSKCYNGFAVLQWG